MGANATHTEIPSQLALAGFEAFSLSIALGPLQALGSLSVVDLPKIALPQEINAANLRFQSCHNLQLSPLYFEIGLTEFCSAQLTAA